MSKHTSRPTYAHSFDKVAQLNINRSKFDLSHGYKTTLDGGYLVPTMIADVLPGDSWKCDINSLCRMTTPFVPFMDNVKINYFAFAIPKRLIWENFEDFYTGSHKGKLGTSHTTYPTRSVTVAEWERTPLYDYMGIPKPATGKAHKVNALPFRAYELCYQEWFRDENLINPYDIPLGDSDGSFSPTLHKRGKRKDYFTSALPFVQKGPDVSLPLGSWAPVKARAVAADKSDGGDGLRWSYVDGGSPVRPSTFPHVIGLSAGSELSKSILDTSLTTVDGDVKPRNLWADLSTATAATINSLREAFAVQHLFERDARSGSRMCESLQAHWGVTCPDFRLQRPEYIGGGSIDFAVNTVAQTSGTQSGVETPQGNLAAFAKSVGRCRFQYSAVEPCYILVVACVTAQLTYQQGIDRLFFKSVRTDECWPEFAHLGEQPIYEKEIYATGDPDNDERIFGYQERYAEYRYFPSQITGKLRSTVDGTLDVWHLAQEFENAPSLSQDFIEENPPFKRVLAVQNEPEFLLDIWYDCKAIRPLPMFATPSLLDHF